MPPPNNPKNRLELFKLDQLPQEFENSTIDFMLRGIESNYDTDLQDSKTREFTIRIRDINGTSISSLMDSVYKYYIQVLSDNEKIGLDCFKNVKNVTQDEYDENKFTTDTGITFTADITKYKDIRLQGPQTRTFVLVLTNFNIITNGGKAKQKVKYNGRNYTVRIHGRCKFILVKGVKTWLKNIKGLYKKV